jgi:hypothetical protein
MAIVLVLIVMAVAGLLAAAMLTGSALQANSSTNAISAAVARAEAESGVHLAIYYMMNPTYAPTYGTESFWPGAPGITFSAPGITMPGSVSVTVTNPSANVYNIVAVGSSDTSSGNPVVSRTISAQVQLQQTFEINQGAGFNSPINVRGGMTFAGVPTAVATTGAVTLSGGSVTGNIDASSVSGGVPLGSIDAAPSTPPAPLAGTVTDYTQPYTYQGQTYYPTAVSSPLATGVLLPTASNPLGVYCYNGNLKISGVVAITGTLMVTGSLTDAGSLTVTAAQGMPALVVNQNIAIQGSLKTLIVNGVAYTGTGVTGVSSSPTDVITINGALLASSGGVASSYNGALAVTYSSLNTSLPNFSSSNEVVSGWQITSWSE